MKSGNDGRSGFHSEAVQSTSQPIRHDFASLRSRTYLFEDSFPSVKPGTRSLQGGPIETITYDLKKLSIEKIRLIREILAKAIIGEAKKRE